MRRTLAHESAMPSRKLVLMSTPNILDSFRLDGKVALVTGAASGLGAAIAIALAQAGATVAVHGNRRAATETAATIGPQSRRLPGRPRRPQPAPRPSSPPLTDRFGHIDILINNAGTIHRDAAVDTTLASWQQVLQVNLTSVFQLSPARRPRCHRARTPPARSSTSPRCSASRAASASPPTPSSKGGVAQLTKALANEWAPQEHPGQRHRPRLLRHHQHRSPPGRRDPQPPDPRTHPRRPLGPTPGPRRRRALSSAPPPATTSPAPSSPSTAAGWADSFQAPTARPIPA